MSLDSAVRARNPRHSARAGVSLTEVLMSLLIMSIGVVSLITLFPISTLRVIEATNMTNATVLRYNAEAVIDSSPELIFDPDPGLPSPPNPREHLGENYLVDPLGFSVLKSAGVAAASPSDPAWTFGYKQPAGVTIPLPKRYPGVNHQTLTESIARQLVSLSDNFSEQGTGRAVPGSTASPATSVTIEPSVDLSSITISTQTQYQATLYNLAGDRSEVRVLTAVSQPAPHQLNWIEPLPSDFGEIGNIQVTSNEEFYTWMLSVRRRSSGPARVDVVVFIKRLLAAADADNDGTLDGNQDEQVFDAILDPTSTPNNRVTINFNAAAGIPKPQAKRGGYMFDTKNCIWYRITSIKDPFQGITMSNPTESITVTLEDSIRLSNKRGATDHGGVVFPRGVVAVFPLELKSP